MFITVDGWQARVTGLLATSTVLPLAPGVADTLCDRLGAGHTWLTLRSAWGFEIVKASCDGGAVAIQRAQEGTTAISGDVCAAFEWTAPAVREFVQEGLGGVSPEVCDVVAGPNGLVVVGRDHDNLCRVFVDRDPCGGATWRAANVQYTQGDDGCISHAIATGGILLPGVYKNATITVDANGNIVGIAQGSNIVFTGGGCCTCQGDPAP